MLNLNPQQFASWNDPVEMLYACHSKVKRFCKQLQILPDYIAKNGINQAVKNDVQQILNYFNIAAPLHHDDEELQFFPALLEVLPDAEKALAQQNIDELERQHVGLHQTWAELAMQLTALIQGERNTVDGELISRFVGGYDVHIPLEEPLFELGKRYLTQPQLQVIGKIMFVRRQLSK